LHQEWAGSRPKADQYGRAPQVDLLRGPKFRADPDAECGLQIRKKKPIRAILPAPSAVKSEAALGLSIKQVQFK
jgi:hypothetical protein